jgi:AcrR family transcriptional regulator
MARKKPKSPPRTYPAHRERQRKRILDAAEKVFAERGIDRVTMGELTAASGLQPSTMYQYFSKKDDIVWAIVGDIMGKASVRSREADASATSALDKIIAFLEYMAEELANQPAQVRFMAQFDAIYSHDWPVERLLALEAQSSNFGSEVFRDLIGEGIAEGSLRSDLDPDLTMQAIINTAIGTQRRLASLGRKVELEYGQSIDRLFRETIRVIVLGLRAAGSLENESSKQLKGRKVTSARRAK